MGQLFGPFRLVAKFLSGRTGQMRVLLSRGRHHQPDDQR
ncbi:MAG: hypothetical protein RJB10_738, partial [Pseudomonadota bacterium]